MTLEKWDDSEDTKTSASTDTHPSSDRAVEDRLWYAKYKPLDKNVDKDDKKLAKAVEEAELQRLGQSNELRPWFMAVVLTIAGVLVLSSCFVAIWLTIFERMTDAIGVGFIVSLGVETIGVVAIIAHYLFATPDSNLLDEDHRQEG